MAPEPRRRAGSTRPPTDAHVSARGRLASSTATPASPTTAPASSAGEPPLARGPFALDAGPALAPPPPPATSPSGAPVPFLGRSPDATRSAPSADPARASNGRGVPRRERSSASLVQEETPRLRRGGIRSLTIPGVSRPREAGSLGSASRSRTRGIAWTRETLQCARVASAPMRRDVGESRDVLCSASLEAVVDVSDDALRADRVLLACRASRSRA